MNARAEELLRLAGYDFVGRNEADIRGDWIEPLLRLLGYGLGTRHSILREESLRLDPPVRMIASSRYEIDFVPTVFGKRLWIIEAKRPQTDLFSNEHLGQAWSYATDPRVAVPTIVLCDGVRLGVFDVTVSDWTQPIFDCQKEDIPDRFEGLFQILGAPRVAEATRTRQLKHLRDALEAQIDVAALDRTVVEVKEMAAEVKPIVQERRQQIRKEAREAAEARGQAAIEAAGMWGHVQHLNEPHGPNWTSIDRAVEIVLATPPIVRSREFDDIEKATTPQGQSETRMWFSVRVMRMGAAALLVGEEGIGEHAREVALTAAQQHATGFAGDPLLQAAYRLQRAVGPLGWRMAALTKPQLDAEAQRLREQLEIEEWLRLDGAMGVTGYDNYIRMARLLPRMLLAQVAPWTPAGLNAAAEEIEKALDELPKPPGFDHLQPVGDPWLDSWRTGNPAADLSLAIAQQLPARTRTEAQRLVSAEMLEILSDLPVRS